MKDSWKHLLLIYRIMLRYWGYMLSGFITMLGFALVSGVSITMVIPLFDYVFRKSAATVIIHTDSGSMIHALGSALARLFPAGGPLNGLGKARLAAFSGECKTVFEATSPGLLLNWICISVITLVLLKNILFYLNKVFFSNLRGNVVKDARNMIFQKYLDSSLAFFGSNQVGDSIVRITSDVTAVSNLCIASLFEVIRNFILVAVYAITAIILNAKLFAVSMALVPVYAFIVSYLGGKLKKYAKRQRTLSSHLFSTIAEKLSNMYVVKAFAQEAREMAFFRAINRRYFRYWRKSILYSSVNTPLSEMNGTLVGVLILIVGGGQVIAGHISLGGFTAFLFAVFSTLSPIKKLTGSYMDIKKGMVSLERVSDILNQPEEVTETAAPVAKPSFNERIVLDAVSFAYGSGEPVLHDISFSIRKGERVALVGKSGSGKTTLVNLLPRLFDVTGGSIAMDGIPLHELRLKDLRRLFGIVTQESVLFNDTVAGNISYGADGDVPPEKVREAARIAYADEFIEALPRKYDEIIQPRGSNFSGGQKQRLCIARAILNDPPILIFDEATSALDSDAESKVQKAIEQATANRTVIVIAHRLSTILSSDKICVLENGRITGIGRHEELLASCAEYQLLYNLQFNA